MKISPKGRTLFAVADQGLQSVINLLSNVFVLTYSTKQEYGLYGVGFAIVVLVIGVANALVMLQMTVNAAEKPIAYRKRYFASMFLVLWALCVVLIILVWLGAYLFGYLHSDSYRLLVIAISSSLPGVLTIEFCRQYLYFHSMSVHVFVMDLAYIVMYFSLLFFLVFLDGSGVYYFSLVINGVVSLFIGAIFLTRTIRLPLFESVGFVRESVAKSLRDGLWALLGVFVTALQGQGYVYLLAYLKSASVVAEMNLARLFLSPLQVVSNGISRIVIPKMSKFRSGGDLAGSQALAYKVFYVVVVSLSIYMLAILQLWRWIDDYLVAKGYEDLLIPVLLWGAFFFAQAFCDIYTRLLTVCREFRVITLSGAGTALVVFMCSIFAIQYFGITGAISTLVMGNIVLGWVLLHVYRRYAFMS